MLLTSQAQVCPFPGWWHLLPGHPRSVRWTAPCTRDPARGYLCCVTNTTSLAALHSSHLLLSTSVAQKSWRVWLGSHRCKSSVGHTMLYLEGLGKACFQDLSGFGRIHFLAVVGLATPISWEPPIKDCPELLEGAVSPYHDPSMPRLGKRSLLGSNPLTFASLRLPPSARNFSLLMPTWNTFWF